MVELCSETKMKEREGKGGKKRQEKRREEKRNKKES